MHICGKYTGEFCKFMKTYDGLLYLIFPTIILLIVALIPHIAHDDPDIFMVIGCTIPIGIIITLVLCSIVDEIIHDMREMFYNIPYKVVFKNIFKLCIFLPLNIEEMHITHENWCTNNCNESYVIFVDKINGKYGIIFSSKDDLTRFRMSHL